MTEQRRIAARVSERAAFFCLGERHHSCDGRDGDSSPFTPPPCGRRAFRTRPISSQRTARRDIGICTAAKLDETCQTRFCHEFRVLNRNSSCLEAHVCPAGRSGSIPEC